MGVGTGIGVAGIVGSGIVGGVMGMKGANAQANAASQAGYLNYLAQEDALNFQKQEWNTQQQNLAPWLQTGKAGLSQLAQLLGIGKDNGTGGYGSLLQGFNTPFVAPTAATEQNDPGYQFRLKQGDIALENSAAARGGLLSSGTAKEEQQFGQDYASNEYQNVYNRSLQNWENQFNVFETNQANTYNRLAGISGMGQQTAATLGQQGQNAASNIGNIYMTGAQAQGQDLMAAGQARASGYASLANVFGSSFGNLSQLEMLNQLYNSGYFG